MTRLFRLHSPALLLEGADTRRFLNSMLTQNFRDMPVGTGNHTAITDRKGRVEGLLHGTMLREDQALLVLDDMDLEWTIDRLDMYIIMDPIELTPLAQSHVVLSLQGADCDQVLTRAGLPLPEAGGFDAGFMVRNDRTDPCGVDLVTVQEKVEEVHAKLLESGAITGSNEDFDALRIRRGLPRWPVDMGKRAFLHELGLSDRVVSYSKGCYLGQEVINRMQTMGKVNRRLTRVRMDGPASPGPLTLDGDAVGDLTSVGTIDDQTWGLGLLRSTARTAGLRVRCGALDGTVDP